MGDVLMAPGRILSKMKCVLRLPIVKYILLRCARKQEEPPAPQDPVLDVIVQTLCGAYRNCSAMYNCNRFFCGVTTSSSGILHENLSKFN